MNKFILFIVFLAALIVSGCKGKDEKQVMSVPPSAELQGKGGESSVPGTSPSQTPFAGGAASGPSISPEIIVDTPPRVTSLKVLPETPVAGDKIKAEAETFDKEGDRVTVEYHWSKNGEPLSETSDTLSLSENFKRGDKVTLTVMPDDGKRKGNPVSASITVANSLPVIKPSQETYKFEGREYSYQVKAIDPDGDPLIYSLKTAPEGMTINPTTGLLHWIIPSDHKGKVTFTVSVSDGQGGEVLQGLSLEIMPGKKK